MDDWIILKASAGVNAPMHIIDQGCGVRTRVIPSETAKRVYIIEEID